MKSGLVLLIALLAGVLGGTAAYQVAKPASSSAEAAPRESLAVQQGDRGPGKGPRFAPCKRPATLQGDRCVTDVTRTVVVPGTSVPAQTTGSAGGAPAPAPVPFGASGHDQEGRPDGGDGEEGHPADDDDDDPDDDRDDTDPTDTFSDDVTDTHGDDDGGTQTRTRTRD